MIARHRKLRIFFLNNKIVQALLLRKFVPKAQSVVIKAETYDHGAVAVGLMKRRGHLVIMIAYRFHFAPDRRPGLVERCGFDTFQRKRFTQRESFDFETEPARFDHRLPFVRQFVNRGTFAVHLETHQQVSVRRFQLFRTHHKRCGHKKRE